MMLLPHDAKIVDCHAQRHRNEAQDGIEENDCWVLHQAKVDADWEWRSCGDVHEMARKGWSQLACGANILGHLKSM